MRFDRSFYTPKNPTKVIERPELNAIVYYLDDRNGFFGTGFSGKRAKPDFNYKFKSSEERETYLEKRYFWHLQEIQKNRQARRDSNKVATQNFLAALVPGTILYDTWGYEQTNVEFYQVVERKGSRVLIQELSCKTVPGSESSWASDRVVPGGPLDSAPVWKNVRGQGIKICDSISLRLFPADYMTNGVHRSWYA